MSTAPRRARQQEVRRHYVSVTLPAETRTTFRYVVGVATLSTSSRLRRSPHPYANVRLRHWHRSSEALPVMQT